MGKATPDLTGVFLKLDRAETHIEAIRNKTSAFTELDPPPFGFRTKTTPHPDKTVEYVLYAIVRKQPPRDFAPMIGDAVHNIRSALDHFVYELSPPKARKAGTTQLPIFVDECEFKIRGTPRIKGIVGDERTLIERYQPYNTRHGPPRSDPLAILSRLSNLDTHRLLIPVIAVIDLTKVWIGSTNAEIDITYINLGPVEHHTKIVAFTARPTDRTKDMQVHPQANLQVQLPDTGLDRNISLNDLLRTLHHYVRRDIIDGWFKYGMMPPDPNSTG